MILQKYEQDKAEQLWVKSEPDNQGFFTLKNYSELLRITEVRKNFRAGGNRVPKMLTATSEIGLKLKGNPRTS